ncbi:serine/threonine-protein kinase [Nucisporomicrobium flavum]|uniref:serine/threonine-protein kinase n=1 Tax=Nucisporomicrobium flavum TaxID=2785915 RepID=UPI0018F4F347|nr:serine/threonine-protein kinase [Nucisporomicrobium flavum]
MLSSGSLLDNRYRLDERIATGGMGDVWRGTDVVLGRTIAVKVLRTAMLADPEFAARFYGEARMMAAFRHPGVVEVYDYSAGNAEDEDQCAYLVMAFVDGEPLSARLKEQGRLSVGETMSIVAQAADALHAAHENGTVHRDVKPGNLIVKPNGAVILVDFGVARSAQVTSVTGLNAIVGTALYMAPEQVAKGNVSPATDIYALGAVAYHCIAGVPPFDGDNALQVALRHLEDDPEPLPDSLAPPEVRELISQAMAKNPADRFASAAEFAEAALAAAGSLDWRAQTGTSMTRTGLVRPSTTGTTLGGAALGGAAALGAAGATGARMRAQSLTGTALTRPMSPGAPGRTMPVQRNLLEAAPPLAPARPKQSRGQLAVLFTVIALFLLAGGLGVAIWLSSGNGSDDNPGSTTGVVPTDSQDTDQPDQPVVPTETTPDRVPQRPNGATPQQTLTTKPTRTPTPSAPTSTPATPTTKPTTTRPATPTTVPTTTPETPPTTQPTEGGDGGGDSGGGDSGGTGTT